MNTDHIVHNRMMECLHCGCAEALKIPSTIDAILKSFDAFLDAHKDCKPPQAETVMSDYIKGFDSGYEYVLHEIEKYIKQYPDNKFALTELLAHLKMEGKPE
jgi:hypothetical protein